MLHIMLAYDLNHVTSQQRKLFDKEMEKRSYNKLGSVDTTLTQCFTGAVSETAIRAVIMQHVNASARAADINSIKYDVQIGNSPVYVGVYAYPAEHILNQRHNFTSIDALLKRHFSKG